MENIFETIAEATKPENCEKKAKCRYVINDEKNDRKYTVGKLKHLPWVHQTVVHPTWVHHSVDIN